ncbi:hypothetical protein ALQ61_02401 [Pseudomonas coronafaciens pv. zizaniae]|uniref:hypothetical protein n=1 Tax=Pseudomonas coronafaciens TaxID=53409 RepID=UPI000F0031E4|nr:hypothetical protein [Pseudomonas coronafaciens]RMN30499.1 hypothetical protein ALQ61_02401 [Pseudomonas coronafaciens pv. zizaniae]
MLTPADLFMECWEAGRRLSGAVVTNIMLPDNVFKDSVDEALLSEDADESYTKLKSLWADDGTGAAKGRMLIIARAIDSFFNLIHPRALYSAKTWEPISLAHWMREMKSQRQGTGVYARAGKYLLIPKGPLTRDRRDEFASSAYSFSDQFEFLAVVPTQLLNDTMPITVDVITMAQDWSKGVGPANSRGDETVAFVPVAQLSEHLHIAERTHNGQHFADFSLAAPLDAAEILKSQIDDVGFADIVFAPELVVDEGAADRLQKLMRNGARQTRIIVAGSGATVEQQDGMSWNEARVMNGRGTELWRQRKVWQAGLDKTRAKALGLTTIPATGLVMEDNHAGSKIIVADIDGFGRCVVLICQDLQANPLASELIRCYQPDWVFVPILDSGAGVARWAHQRAYELSAISPARFLVASSTSMADMLSAGDVPCGLAVGPKNAIGPDAGRMLCTVRAHKLPHGHGILVWRSEGWMKTIMESM